MAENMTVKEYIPVANIGGRQHPDYAAHKSIWDFLLASFRGGMGMQGRSGLGNDSKAGLAINGYYAGLYRWKKEQIEDYNVKVYMTPYVPYARRIVSAFVNYVTKKEPVREGNIGEFGELIDNCDKQSTPLRNFVRIVLSRVKVMGQYNVLVDMPKSSKSDGYVSLADQIADGQKPYCVLVNPQNVIDWQIDQYGGYEWAIIENTRLVNSIEQEKAVVVTTRTYWDARCWQRYEQDAESAAWTLKASNTHNVGKCPLLRFVAEDLDEMPETPESWFFDLADINRAIYNLKANDYAGYYYQIPQLILPVGTIEDGKEKVVAHSEGWQEEESTKGISRYIQPTGNDHEQCRIECQDLRQEMFRIAGLYYKTDSRDAETAEAKAWDHEEMNQFLASFADTADAIETKIFETAGAWLGKKDAKIKVGYKHEYRVSDLQKVIAAILDIKTIGYSSETGRKEVTKQAYREILEGRVPDELLKKIDAEIDVSEEPDPLGDFDMSRDEEFTDNDRDNKKPTGGQ